MNVFTLPMALFLAVAASGMWAFIAVVSWADIRRKEREAYYRQETMKKISEMPSESGLALLREDERNTARRRREKPQVGRADHICSWSWADHISARNCYSRARVPCRTDPPSCWTCATDLFVRSGAEGLMGWEYLLCKF